MIETAIVEMPALPGIQLFEIKMFLFKNYHLLETLFLISTQRPHQLFLRPSQFYTL